MPPQISSKYSQLHRHNRRQLTSPQKPFGAMGAVIEMKFPRKDTQCSTGNESHNEPGTCGCQNDFDTLPFEPEQGGGGRVGDNGGYPIEAGSTPRPLLGRRAGVLPCFHG